MRRQDGEPACAADAAILRAFGGGSAGGFAFQHFETIGGHKQRARWLVKAVIGAAYALGETACAFVRADADDEIDLAPVDTEIEGGSADDGAETGREQV